MPRSLAHAAVLIGVSMLAGAAYGQGTAIALPTCDIVAARTELSQGKLPSFRGCRFEAARSLLQAYKYQAFQRDDEAVTGIEQGIVTEQSHDGNEVYLTVSSGAGYPPAKPEPVTAMVKSGCIPAHTSMSPGSVAA